MFEGYRVDENMIKSAAGTFITSGKPTWITD